MQQKAAAHNLVNKFILVVTYKVGHPNKPL